MVSPQLQRFKRKSANLYNCRCPLCGDSKRNKTKARGYFFVEKNQFYYKCHNCGVCLGLANFLKAVAPHLHKEYVVERYMTGNDRKNTPTPAFKFTKPKFKSVADELQKLVSLTKLPKNHPAVQFAIKRQFPKSAFLRLYYTDDFAAWAKLLDSKREDLVESDARLVIPFFNREGQLYAAQGRSLDPTNRLRYITCVADREDGLSDRRWFGLERHDTDKPTIIVEGPLDALFLDNTIAMVGAGAFKYLPVGVDKETTIIAYDNEPRNKEICKYMHTMLHRGYRVCVWPERLVGKDINDIILAGTDHRTLHRIISENAVSGLAGIAQLSVWRKTK